MRTVKQVLSQTFELIKRILFLRVDAPIKVYRDVQRNYQLVVDQNADNKLIFQFINSDNLGAILIVLFSSFTTSSS